MYASKLLFSALPKPLNDFLRRVSRRRRWQEGAHVVLPTLGLGLGITLAFVWLGRFYPLAQPTVLLLSGLSATLVGLVIILAYVWLRPFSLQMLARQLDHRFNLEERISTAMELAIDGGQTPHIIIDSQLADALQHLKRLDPAQFFPTKLSWRWLALNGVLIAAISAGLLTPNPQVQVLQRQAKNRDLIAKQKDQLEEIRADLLANQALRDMPEDESALRTLDEVVEALKNDDLGPEHALAALSEAEQALSDLQNALDQRQAALNDLAQTINQFDSSASLTDAAQQRDRARAAELLQSAAADPPADRETRENLANALRQAAQAAAQSGSTSLAESLDQAAGAVEQPAEEDANSAATQEALQQAAEALAEAEQQLANQDALERALGNIQEARQQLAESAGQAEGGQGQQAEQGQERRRPGQGQGPGDFPGEEGGGAGRADPGQGADGLFADEAAPDELPTGNGPSQGRLDSYEAEYPSIHWGGDGGPIVNPAPQGAEGGLPVGTGPVDPNQEENPTLVPYNQVYGRYADAAGEALNDTYIPLGMKDFVRNYFGALEPGGK